MTALPPRRIAFIRACRPLGGKDFTIDAQGRIGTEALRDTSWFSIRNEGIVYHTRSGPPYLASDSHDPRRITTDLTGLLLYMGSE